MTKKLLLPLLLLLLPIMALSQHVIQSFDTELDSTYFIHLRTWNTTDYVTYAITTLDTQTVYAGAGALRVDWSVEDSYQYGGYARLKHVLPPDSGLYDWSAYDTLSLWYYNDLPQELVGRSSMRLTLLEASDAPDTTTGTQELENWFSFHYILDDDPGWNEIKIALIDGRNNDEADEWNGEAFNRTGWTGIKGNDELDTDKIKGFYIEFVIKHEQEGDINNGSIVLDHMTLKGYKGISLILFNGKNYPPSHKPFAWGQSTLEVEDGAGATPGTNALKWVQGDEWGNGWTGAGWNLPGYNLEQEWQTDSLKFKLRTESNVDSIRLRFEDGANKVKYEFEPIDDGAWHDYAIALRDFVFHESDTFDPGNIKVFQMTSIANAVAGNTFYFDDMWTGNPDIDVVGPAAPEGVIGIPNTTEHYNLIAWNDVPDEAGEVYNVYYSEQPIVTLDDPSVSLLKSEIPEGEQSAIHNLRYPLKEKELAYYYAVVAVDAAGNEGEIGATLSATLNTAEMVPAISLNPPSNFVADGDISEWYDSDIMPFVLAPSESHIAKGVFDNDADMTATAFLAMDDDYLYIGVDVVDDVYSYDPEGNFWEDDIVEIYIGLYNQVKVHTGFQRGDEPDYKLILESDKMFNSSASSTAPLYELADANYEFVDFGVSDWAVEVKIPFDSLLIGNAAGDARFHPINGMKIPLDIVFHDSDSPNVRDGILSYSPNNNDNSWQGAQFWYYTWIGDTTSVETAVNNRPSDHAVHSFELEQNYPNPFNSETVIEYYVARAGEVGISVYNLRGQKVRTLVNQKQPAGKYSITFDASDLPSGMYFYRFESGGFVQMKKMLYVR